MKYFTAVSVAVSVVAMASAAALPAASTRHIQARQEMKSAIDKLVMESKNADGVSDKSLNELLDHAFELAGQPRDSSTGSSSSSTVCADGQCVTAICDATGKCTKSTKATGKRANTKVAKRQDFGEGGFDPSSGFGPGEFMPGPGGFPGPNGPSIPEGIPGLTAPIPGPPNGVPPIPAGGGSTSYTCNNGNCVTVVCDNNGNCKNSSSKAGAGGSMKVKRQDENFDPFSFIPPGIPGITAPIPPNNAPNPPNGGSTSTSCNNGVCVTTVCDASGSCKTTKSNQGNSRVKQRRH